MVKINPPYNDIGEMVFQWWRNQKKDEKPRPHLGASQIGKKCSRELYYGFRWALTQLFDGRMYRLFDVGHKAEPRFCKELRAIGIEVYEYDDRTITPENPKGKQWQVAMYGGHFGGSMDGVARNVPQGGQRWHILEFKTWRDETKETQEGFQHLKKHGVKYAKYQHYCQMQIYMGLTGIDRALYYAENKNDSDIYTERVHFDEVVFKMLVEKAYNIIFGITVPGRISDNPDSAECRFCTFKDVCHGTLLPDINCRTCEYSEPRGDGEWYCNYSKSVAGELSHFTECKRISYEEQLKGCENYSVIKKMLKES